MPNGAGLPETLDEVKLEVRESLTRVETEFHRIGVLFNHVADSRLAERVGYESAEAFFAQAFEGRLDGPTARRYGALARTYSVEACRKYGAPLLSELLSYERLSRQQASDGDPGNLIVLAPDAQGFLNAKPFSECSLKEMVGAVQQLRMPMLAAVPGEDAKRIQHIHDSLDRLFNAPDHIQIRARAHGGETLVNFSNVPLERLEDFARVLQELRGGADEPLPLPLKKSA